MPTKILILARIREIKMRQKIWKKEHLKILFIIILTLAIGFLALNQAMSLLYKAELAMNPCDLCTKLNPHLKSCFEEVVNNPYYSMVINISNITDSNINISERRYS